VFGYHGREAGVRFQRNAQGRVEEQGKGKEEKKKRKR